MQVRAEPIPAGLRLANEVVHREAELFGEVGERGPRGAHEADLEGTDVGGGVSVAGQLALGQAGTLAFRSQAWTNGGVDPGSLGRRLGLRHSGECTAGLGADPRA
jgi:hypothetical protein